MPHITLSGDELSPKQVLKVALEGAPVTIAEPAIKRVEACRQFIENQVNEGAVIYGVTTGFGKNASVIIREKAQAEQLQYNLVVSHSVGVGEPFSPEMARAIMVIRLNTLLGGRSGIRLETLNLLAGMLNNEICPIIPVQGSVGASGDLCPLAHMASALIGVGEVFVKDSKTDKWKRAKAANALTRAGLKPIKLSYKEGLALINGTTVMAALGVMAVAKAKKLLKLAGVSSALVFEALGARAAALDKRVHDARGHKGQRDAAERLRKHLSGSSIYNISPKDILKRCPGWKNEYAEHLEGDYSTVIKEMLAHAGDNAEARRLVEFAARKCVPQDAYSIRCTAQVFGASLQAIRHVDEVISGELNAAVDNPLIFLNANGHGDVLSGGNFHGQPLALVLDYLKLATAELGNFLERQINKLQDPATNDFLPAFLTLDPGLQSGLMITQYTAAGLVSENKVLVHPASADSIPTSANQEDHVSMGTIAGRQALEIAGNVEKILGIHLLNAAQAFDLRVLQLDAVGIPIKQGKDTQKLYHSIREQVPFLAEDRFLYEDLEKVKGIVEGFEG